MTGSTSVRRGTVALVAAVVTLSGCTATTPMFIERSSAPPGSSSGPATTAASATSAGPATPTITTGVVQGTDGWSTYTNAKYRFSIRFPTRIYGPSGTPCTKKWSNGNWDYQASPGVVPAAVRRFNNSFTITQRYGYLPSVTGYRADGSSLFQSCARRTTTSSMFGSEDLPPVAALGFMVKPQFTKADVEQWVLNGYDYCGKRTKVSFTPSAQGTWTDVTFTCPKHPASVATAPVMRWYQDADLYVEFSFGFLSDVKNVTRRSVEHKIADSLRPVA